MISILLALICASHANASTDEHQTHPSAPAAQTHEVIKRITRAPASVDTASEEMHIAPAGEGQAITPPAVETQSAPNVPAADSPKAETPKAEAPKVSAPKVIAVKNVDASTSLRYLTNGNTRFATKNFRADGKSPADRQRLATYGEHPHAIVLSCSDSRTPPELIFDQGLGEIYSVRVTGEALDASVIASVETAVEQLGVKLLVVMGHTQCGTIEAALRTKDTGISDSLERVLADIRPRLSSLPASVAGAKPSRGFEAESTVNADGVARDLVKRSAIIRARVEAGELVIKTALYRVDSGKVKFY